MHSIEGVKIAEISKTVDRLLKEAGNPLLVAMPSLPPKESPQTRIESLIRSNPCMVFMKGTPKDARCGFSRQLIELLDRHGCPYASFNILEDEEIRQQLKEYSNWPTFPQLYINREFIGGLDIAKELDTSGDLAKMLPKREPVTAEVLATGQSSLETRLTALINKSKVMLFMKGTPSVPECGFSSQIVDLLGKVNAKFESFNIFEDEEVRQGLKSFSNWPTYPQLYVNGELIGGVDIVKVCLDSCIFGVAIINRTRNFMKMMSLAHYWPHHNDNHKNKNCFYRKLLDNKGPFPKDDCPFKQELEAQIDFGLPLFCSAFCLV